MDLVWVAETILASDTGVDDSDSATEASDTEPALGSGISQAQSRLVVEYTIPDSMQNSTSSHTSTGSVVSRVRRVDVEGMARG
jgi:hypothetical protein